MGRETREFGAPEVLDGTIVLQLGYDGSGYSGFAEQPGQATVAGEIRRAVETFLRRPIELTCAGRTDAGAVAARYRRARGVACGAGFLGTF